MRFSLRLNLNYFFFSDEQKVQVLQNEFIKVSNQMKVVCDIFEESNATFEIIDTTLEKQQKILVNLVTFYNDFNLLLDENVKNLDKRSEILDRIVLAYNRFYKKFETYCDSRKLGLMFTYKDSVEIKTETSSGVRIEKQQQLLTKSKFLGYQVFDKLQEDLVNLFIVYVKNMRFTNVDQLETDIENLFEPKTVISTQVPYSYFDEYQKLIKFYK
jgi:hypothetical protein